MKPIKLVLSVLFLIISHLLNFANAQNSSNFELFTNTDGEFNQKGYFTLRPDYRRCVFPLCGGYWVRHVNRKLTRCADGSRQEECYVASLNWKKLGFDPLLSVKGNLVLVRGKIAKKKFPNFGNLGKFNIKAAYQPFGESAKDRLYVGLENNDIVCITTPCFSIEQYKLNRKRIRSISGIDFSPVGASDKDMAAAYERIKSGDILLAAGMNIQVEEFAGPGITFIAYQFFLPLKPPI